MTRVIHIKDKELDGANFSSNEVYIGRPNNTYYGASIWGNPFVIGKDGNREEVIDKYEDYIMSDEMWPTVQANLHTLRGKNLVCYCKPLACHGDVLIKLVDRF